MTEKLEKWVIPDGHVPIALLHYDEKDDRMGLFLNLDGVPDVESWGALLGSIGQIVANHTCAKEGTFDPEPWLEKIRLAFLVQLDEPSPPNLGEAV